MATTLSPHDVGLQLLENSLATAFALGALILIFGPVSGAHFNPAVSLVFALKGDLSPREAALYAATQIGGGIIGLATAWRVSC